MTDVLQKLFGGPARVKLLRLFLFNPQRSFTLAEAAQRSRVKEREARKEILQFVSMNLLKCSHGRSRASAAHYSLNDRFEYTQALQSLLLNAPAQGETTLKRLRDAGSLKLVVLSGVFMGEWERTLDILIVGENIKDLKLRNGVRYLEAEIGKEIRYATMGTDEFFYRYNLNDHLLRDVLDYPHRIALDKLNIGLR